MSDNHSKAECQRSKVTRSTCGHRPYAMGAYVKTEMTWKVDTRVHHFWRGSVFTAVCLSVCLFVGQITQKVVSKFSCNFGNR